MTLNNVLGIVSVVWLICFLIELILYKIEQSVWKNRIGSENVSKTSNNLLMLIPMYVAAPIVLAHHVYQLISEGGFAKSSHK